MHPAAWDPEERLKLIDEFGIDAQVLYPNAIGLGGQNLVNTVKDPRSRCSASQLYNDAMAEVQEESGNRFLPMPIMPAWNIDDCVREAKRCAAMGYRGVNMTSDPQDSGSPDLGEPGVGSVLGGLRGPAAAGALPHRRQPDVADLLRHDVLAEPGRLRQAGDRRRVAVPEQLPGAAQQRVLGDVRPSPDLKMVSVESGIGWVPFMLEAMDYELEENAPEHAKKLEKLPSEYFRDNWYATFWFENGRGDLQHLIDAVGEDNVMFETDFPHPTCLYPSPLEVGRGQDRVAPTRDPAQGDGRQRGRAVPPRRLSERARLIRRPAPRRSGAMPRRRRQRDARHPGGQRRRPARRARAGHRPTGGLPTGVERG